MECVKFAGLQAGQAFPEYVYWHERSFKNLVETYCQIIIKSLSSTLRILSGVAERFSESLPEVDRNFHAMRVEPGH
jgi:hypothetical protein